MVDDSTAGGAGADEADARADAIRFVTRDVSDEEAAAVTAVLLAALDEERGIRSHTGLRLLPQRDVDFRPRGTQRRLAFKGKRNRFVQTETGALVHIQPRRCAWLHLLTSHGRGQKDGREHGARESSTGRHCTAP